MRGEYPQSTREQLVSSLWGSTLGIHMYLSDFQGIVYTSKCHFIHIKSNNNNKFIFQFKSSHWISHMINLAEQQDIQKQQ